MRVYVHGNCQGPAIAALLKEQRPEWDVASYEVFNTKIISEIARYYHYVETADIIISQPIHDGYRNRADLSLNWLRASAKPNAQFVIFPSMFFDGQLVGCRSIKFPAYGMPYHDSLLVHLAVMGVGLQEITRILLDEDLYSDEFLRGEIARSIEEARRREHVDQIDVPMAPFLEEFGSSIQIFHVINHPCRPALANVANQILATLGYPANVHAVGQELIPFPHIPLIPSVERFMATGGRGPGEWRISDGERYHLPSETLSRAEYFDRACEHLRQFSEAEILACLNEPHTKSFLERVAVSNPYVPYIKSWLS